MFISHGIYRTHIVLELAREGKTIMYVGSTRKGPYLSISPSNAQAMEWRFSPEMIIYLFYIMRGECCGFFGDRIALGEDLGEEYERSNELIRQLMSLKIARIIKEKIAATDVLIKKENANKGFSYLSEALLMLIPMMGGSLLEDLIVRGRGKASRVVIIFLTRLGSPVW